MTEKQKFIDYLKTTRDFTGDFVLLGEIVPHCYKTREGDIILIHKIHVCMFQGSDCKDGDIGCLTVYFNGSRRKKHCRTIQQGVELLKVTRCPKDADEAIAIYEQWITKINDITSSYKMIA
jgi:hypothetical protein